jgi:hypothetical protein
MGRVTERVISTPSQATSKASNTMLPSTVSC